MNEKFNKMKLISHQNYFEIINLIIICLSWFTLFKTTESSVISASDTQTAKLLELCNSCDLYLGGLFPIHAPRYIKRSKQSSQAEFVIEKIIGKSDVKTVEKLVNMDRSVVENNVMCGEIKKERGIQRLEAMLYAIDLINADPNLLPGIKLGARIFDTCDRDTIALERSIEFVSDHFLLNSENIVEDFVCDAGIDAKKLISLAGSDIKMSGGYSPRKLRTKIQRRKVLGVIGAASSSVSVQVANLLRLFQVPQISYSSSSPELSNKERFPYFSRVLPSDTLQAKAMADLVYLLQWNYITTISEEGNAGGIDTFINNVKSRKICISESYTLTQTSSEQHVKNMLTEIHEKSTARGVVMFMQDHNIRKLLGIVSEMNLTEHFLWVASDGWGTKRDPISSNHLAAQSAITFSPKFYEIKEFNHYFENLKPATNTRNPWFKEFWEEQFNCTINGSGQSDKSKLNRMQCTGEESLKVTQDGFIHFVIDSVFAMVHAIHNLLKEQCDHLISNKQLFDECLRTTELKGPELLDAIRNVEFTSITGRKVKFIKDKENSGDGLAPFEVFQYQKGKNGEYMYLKIGEWESDKPFSINKSILKWDDGTSNIPKSICKEECGLGEVKQGDDCCWVCVKCDETQYVSEDRKSCIKCNNGDGPNANKTGCEKLPIEYMEFNTAFTLVPVIFSSFGIILTSFTIAVFIRYSETPIIKASGRELCYVLLAGIMSCYLVTFPLVTKPTYFSCFILRFGVSLSLTICLSALFTKTFRLSRIFNNSVKTSLKASCVSPHSQLVICFSIISAQIVLVIVWVILKPPGIDYDFGDPKRVILQCKTQNLYLVISCVYSFFLAILCTIYAVKTRKIPSNFNEARFIGFTMYSICIIWIAFVPIYFGTTAAAGTKASPKNNYKIQLTTLAMCLSLSATVILSCLFLPKLRVVLLKPDKNVRGKGKITMRNVTTGNSSIRTANNSIVTTNNNNGSNGNIPKVASPAMRNVENHILITPAASSDTTTKCDLNTSISVKKDTTGSESPLISKPTSRQPSLKSRSTISNRKASINSANIVMDNNDKNQKIMAEDIKMFKEDGEQSRLMETDVESKVSNEKDLILFRRRSKNCDTSTRESSPESYEYLVTLRKVTSRPVSVTSPNSNVNQVRDTIASNQVSRQSSVMSSLNEINLDEEFFNEIKIKEVVEQCFEELSKNRKLSNNQIFLKGTKSLNVIKEIDSKNLVDLDPTKAKSDKELLNFNASSNGDNTSQDFQSPDTESADSTRAASTIHTPVSIRSPVNYKQTYIEKNSTGKNNSILGTNTILLTTDKNNASKAETSGSKTNADVVSNEMYSLKITFV